MAGLFMAAVLAIPALGADELNWAQELVRPIENTSVHHNETVNYGRYNFAAGPSEKGLISSVTTLEGKTSAILYKATEKNSVFEIFSVYKKYLKDNGFEIVFACEKEACGPDFSSLWYKQNPFENDPGWGNSAPISRGGSYIAARKKSASGDLYVSVYVSSGWWSYPSYRVDVAQAAGLDTQVVPASKIGAAILAEGRIAMYGITFDTGKSGIKPESDATLAELSAFLKASGEVFYVVGHTDGEGSLADNMKLAQDRAGAVKETLIGKYGVPAGMLSAHGGGPLSPLATNSTEAGRALNRRVEIVKAQKEAAPAAAAAAVPAPVSSRGPGGVPDFNIKQEAVVAAQGQPSAAQTQAAAQAQAAAKAAAQAQAAARAKAAVEAQAAAEAAFAAAQAAKAQALAAAKAQAAALAKAAADARAAEAASLIPVPNVIGQWRADGIKILVGQGYKIQETGNPVGIIRGQSPAANTRVKKGSTVSITVGK